MGILLKVSSYLKYWTIKPFPATVRSLCLNQPLRCGGFTTALFLPSEKAEERGENYSALFCFFYFFSFVFRT